MELRLVFVSDNMAAHPGDSEDYVAYVVDKLVMSIESPHLYSYVIAIAIAINELG